jgi:hypothetical protein
MGKEKNYFGIHEDPLFRAGENSVTQSALYKAKT